MTPPRMPRSRVYDGWLYGRTLDPLLGGLHARVARQVPEGCRVLDAACGTGDLAARLGERGCTVLGVDLSPRQAEWAMSHRGREGLSFEVGDASHLDHLADHSFDVATIVLALHEMPSAARVPVLRSLGRVAERVLAVDFSIPMPWNLAGLRNRGFEIGAGPEHFRGFLDFARRGGLAPLAARAGLLIQGERRFDSGTMVWMWLSRPASRPR